MTWAGLCSVHWTDFELSRSQAPDFTSVLTPGSMNSQRWSRAPSVTTNSASISFRYTDFLPVPGKQQVRKVPQRINPSVQPRELQSLFLMLETQIYQLVWFIRNKIGIFYMNIHCVRHFLSGYSLQNKRDSFIFSHAQLYFRYYFWQLIRGSSMGKISLLCLKILYECILNVLISYHTNGKKNHHNQHETVFSTNLQIYTIIFAV